MSKYEHWSSLAPLPFEVVLSAGQKAKEEGWEKGDPHLVQTVFFFFPSLWGENGTCFHFTGSGDFSHSCIIVYSR